MERRGRMRLFYGFGQIWLEQERRIFHWLLCHGSGRDCWPPNPLPRQAAMPIFPMSAASFRTDRGLHERGVTGIGGGFVVNRFPV
jgi:hypothetical protein